MWEMWKIWKCGNVRIKHFHISHFHISTFLLYFIEIADLRFDRNNKEHIMMIGKKKWRKMVLRQKSHWGIGARYTISKIWYKNSKKIKLVVITGISGTVSHHCFWYHLCEGQHVIWKALRYARQFHRRYGATHVDKITGLSPVSPSNKKQRTGILEAQSHVTEVYDFLRLLYARIGEHILIIPGKNGQVQWRGNRGKYF